MIGEDDRRLTVGGDLIDVFNDDPREEDRENESKERDDGMVGWRSVSGWV